MKKNLLFALLIASCVSYIVADCCQPETKAEQADEKCGCGHPKPQPQPQVPTQPQAQPAEQPDATVN